MLKPEYSVSQNHAGTDAKRSRFKFDGAKGIDWSRIFVPCVGRLELQAFSIAHEPLDYGQCLSLALDVRKLLSCDGAEMRMIYSFLVHHPHYF